MPALRVAVDLTALEHTVDASSSGSMQVRFVKALIEHAPGAEFVVLARPRTLAALAPLDAPNAWRVPVGDPNGLQSLLVRVERRALRPLKRSRAADRLRWVQGLRPALARWRPRMLARLQAQVVFCPFISSPGVEDPALPLVAAVHDLQHLSHPHLLSSPERTLRARGFEAISRRAARLVCSAPSVSALAHGCDDVRAERVLTIPPGRLLAPPPSAKHAIAETLARYGLTDTRFVLLVGDFEPRHNHRLVLTALAMFRARKPDSELRLVGVGGPSAAGASFSAMVEQMGLGQFVQFHGQVPRDDVSTLVQCSSAVVAASLYETVGETVLEAMQLGRPVVCSQIPDLAELTGGAALMFDPHRPAELAAAFARVEADAALSDRLARLGPERVATLADPYALAEAYLGVFRDAVATCRPSR